MNSLTVAEILKLDILQKASIRAGTAGLANQVTGITTAEDPDLIQWLTGGEICLTSLYGASVGPLSFQEYINTLAKKGISALIIKTGTRLPEIPAEIIEVGNCHQIPVIELSPDIRFFDVVSSVMKRILDNKAQYYIELQNQLSQLLASGAKEQAVLEYLIQYVPASISLCDSEKNVSHIAQSPEFYSDRAVADRITLPIMCMGEVDGYLQAVTNRYLDENLERLLKHAANLLAVFFLKKYYMAEVEQKYISAFLRDLFRGNLDETQAAEKAESYGWKKEDSFLAASIQLEASGNASKISSALMEMAHLIPKSCYYFCIQDDSLHILYRVEEGHAISALYEPITDIISKLNRYIEKKYASLSFFSGISGKAADIFLLNKKVQEASDALQFGRLFHNNIVKYDDLGALRILTSFSHRDNLEQIIPPAVRKLAEYDKANNTQYLETLDSLLGNNLNLSKTAKELFIHYKTMLHRMDRICQIAEISLDDRQTRLDVELGVKLYMLLPK
ncbi:PucR family transcriptional regulator ligand-binding domain-containing protein [Lachnospiraceae bacterium 62-35]